MARAYQILGWTRALAVGVLLLAGCEREAEPAPEHGLGPACRALLEVAERARACDPALEKLAKMLAKMPKESECRTAAFRLLGGDSPDGQVASTYRASAPAPRLEDSDYAALAALRLPGRVSLRPDVPSAPGVPPTSAKLSGQPLRSDDGNRLQIYAPQGRHELAVRHAGTREAYCVRLAACQDLELTVHGAAVADHPHVDPGSCPATNIAAAPQSEARPSLTQR